MNSLYVLQSQVSPLKNFTNKLSSQIMTTAGVFDSTVGPKSWTTVWIKMGVVECIRERLFTVPHCLSHWSALLWSSEATGSGQAVHDWSPWKHTPPPPFLSATGYLRFFFSTNKNRKNLTFLSYSGCLLHWKCFKDTSTPSLTLAATH